MRKKKPSGPDPQMNRKRGEGLSLKGVKKGGALFWGVPFAALERRASSCRSERKSLDQELKVAESEVQLRMKGRKEKNKKRRQVTKMGKDHCTSIFFGCVSDVEKCDLLIESSFYNPPERKIGKLGKED